MILHLWNLFAWTWRSCLLHFDVTTIYCDLDTAFKNEIVSTLFKTLGITIKFFRIQSFQSNPAERATQSISNIIIHYITKYGNLWCIMSNMATFCLNIFAINHLHNLSIYEIVYGHKPPAITDLQLEGDDLTRPTFYRFSDYLDLLNEVYMLYVILWKSITIKLSKND